MTQTIAKRTKNEYETLAEVFYDPIYSIPVNPRVIVRQHLETKEIRIDVYDCNAGLKITWTNAETNDTRAQWFRDVIISDSYQPIKVRFLGSKVDLQA